MEIVEFTCPVCGTKWTEIQDPKDEWFRLATHQTLCEKCGNKAMEKIKQKWKERLKNVES